MVHFINRLKDGNHNDHCDRCRKSPGQSPTSFSWWSPEETQNRRNTFQYRKGCKWPLSHIILKWGGAKIILCKARTEPKVFTFSALPQYGPWHLSQRSKTREESGYSWEKKQRTLIGFHRWYNSAQVRSWRHHRETLRTGRCFQQSCRVQTNTHITTAFFLSHERACGERNWECNPIQQSLKKKKLRRKNWSKTLAAIRV